MLKYTSAWNVIVSRSKIVINFIVRVSLHLLSTYSLSRYLILTWRWLLLVTGLYTLILKEKYIFLTRTRGNSRKRIDMVLLSFMFLLTKPMTDFLDLLKTRG